jgi:antitoxin component of MazEF toxin-antitoxin module
MAAVTFASKLKEDGSLTIPQEAVEELGLHPGDEVQVRVEAANGIATSASPKMLDEVLKDLLAEAERLEPQPGKESNDPHERAFGEIIKEKYRKMGLDV